MTPERERQLAEWFAQAVELDAADRAGFVERVCAGDEEMRRRFLALLEGLGAGPGFLNEEPATRLDLAALPSQSPQPMAEEGDIGLVIGHYKLLELIGEGGCGMVYVAEQREPVRRRVALKLIKPGMDSKALTARFEAERQAIAMMEHPHIAKFLDAGTTPLGRPYFVMELVRGTRITDFCDQARLSTRERLELFIEVCRAVQHAHQKGVIHRDLKPSNILVTLHDGKPVPKIIDFGIAKATQGSLTDATVYTQLHQFIGTPAYMSPEQAEMTGLDIDTRTDIYSLGVLLYELLTGNPPFDPKELAASGLEAMRRTIREKDPPRPSTRLSTLIDTELAQLAHRRSADPPRLLHLVRGDLDWIAMRCLEKDRNRRYETANGLAADLLRHLNDEPVVARPPSARYRLHKALQRNRGFFLAGGAVALALVLGAVVSVSQAVRASRERDNAEHLRERAEAAAIAAKSEAARGNAAAAFIKTMFLDTIPLVREGNDPSMLLGLMGATVPKIETQLSVFPEVRADVHRIVGKLIIELGDYPSGENQLRTALKDREIYHAPEDLDEAEIRLFLGIAARETERFDLAEEEFGRALRIRRRILGHDHELVAQVLGGLGLTISRRPGPPSAPLENLQKEETMLREALAIEEKAAKDPSIKIILMGAAAQNYSNQGRWEESLHLFDAAIAERARLMTNHHGLMVLKGDRAQILAQSGRLDEAAADFRAIIEDISQRLGAENETALFHKMRLANVLDLQGKCAEAEPLRRDTLRFCSRLAPPDSTDRCLYHARLGRTLLFEGKLAEAEAQFRRELELREKSGDVRSPLTLSVLNRIGAILLAEGRLPDAELVFHDVLARYRANPTPLDRRVECHYLGRWADVLWREGKRDEAERAIDAVAPTAGVGLKPDDGYAFALRGGFRARAHQWELARQDLLLAVELNPQNAVARHGLAALYLRQGEMDLLKRLVAEGVTVLGGTYDSRIAAQVCVDYTVVAGALMDGRVDKLVTMAGSDGFLPYWSWTWIDWFDLYPLARALVNYREGHLESAAEWASKAAAIPSLDPNRPAQGLIVQAMAEYRLGCPIEARATLDRAASLMKSKAPPTDAPDLGDHWADAIMTDALIREAASLIGGSTSAGR
jgi:eukaryotic-like serine/threonine-protein kinase